MPSTNDLAIAALAIAINNARKEVEAFAQATQKASRATTAEAREKATANRNSRVRTALGGAVAGGLAAAGLFAARSALAARRNDADFTAQVGADARRLAGRVDPTIQNKIEPIDRAANRVASITENIARFGGQVTDEQRQRMFDLFNKQEGAVQAERQAIARLANAGVNSAVGALGEQSGVAAGTNTLVEQIQRLANSVEAIRHYIGAQ